MFSLAIFVAFVVALQADTVVVIGVAERDLTGRGRVRAVFRASSFRSVSANWHRRWRVTWKARLPRYVAPRVIAPHVHLHSTVTSNDR
jgi:hypothetical protein